MLRESELTYGLINSVSAGAVGSREAEIFRRADVNRQIQVADHEHCRDSIQGDACLLDRYAPFFDLAEQKFLQILR